MSLPQGRTGSTMTLAELDQVNPELADEARRSMGWPTRAEREAAAKKAAEPVRAASTGQAKAPKPAKPAKTAKPTSRASKKDVPAVEFSK